MHLSDIRRPIWRNEAWWMRWCRTIYQSCNRAVHSLDFACWYSDNDTDSLNFYNKMVWISGCYKMKLQSQSNLCFLHPWLGLCPNVVRTELLMSRRLVSSSCLWISPTPCAHYCFGKQSARLQGFNRRRWPTQTWNLKKVQIKIHEVSVYLHKRYLPVIFHFVMWMCLLIHDNSTGSIWAFS